MVFHADFTERFSENSRPLFKNKRQIKLDKLCLCFSRTYNIISSLCDNAFTKTVPYHCQKKASKTSIFFRLYSVVRCSLLELVNYLSVIRLCFCMTKFC